MSTKRAGKVSVGDRAPDFALPSQYGETVRLGDLIGEKAVVLYFYPRDGTPDAAAEACSFRDGYEDFVEADARGGRGELRLRRVTRAVRRRNGLPFILLSDGGGEVRKLYGVSSTLGIFPGRVTYVIDKGGVVRHVFSSQFGATRHADEALKVVQALNEESPG
jgi:peroxiredoxin Q/BCP